jgi:hypothetical protein
MENKLDTLIARPERNPPPEADQALMRRTASAGVHRIDRTSINARSRSFTTVYAAS